MSGALIQYDQCPYKVRRGHHGCIHIDKKHVRTQPEDGHL